MGEVTTIEERASTRLDTFKTNLLSQGRGDQLWKSLPQHINPQRFDRELTNALMVQPELLAYDPRLVFREVARIAVLGLHLDKDLGEAYLIEAWNYKTKRKEPQARIGYRGLIKLAKQSGKYSRVYAREVHQNDQYDVLQGTVEEIIHRPVLHGEPGQVIEYYAVAVMKDGGTEFERMTLEDVLAIRDRSDAWKAFEDGKIKSTPWETDEGEMAKKTVIRRLCKRLDQSPELSDAIRIEDEAEFPSMRDVTPAPSRARPPSAPKPAQIAPKPTVGRRPPSPNKPAPEKRTAKPYGGKPQKKEAEDAEVVDEQPPPQDDPDLLYSKEESEEQLREFAEQIGGPHDADSLIEVFDLWKTSVPRMLPKHQGQAEACLLQRVTDVFGEKGAPFSMTFFPDEAE